VEILTLFVWLGSYGSPIIIALSIIAGGKLVRLIVEQAREEKQEMSARQSAQVALGR